MILSLKKSLKYLGISLAAFIGACTRPAERPGKISDPINHTSIYDVSVKDIHGKLVNLSGFKGKKILIVNTASKCGYTPQYKNLQKLHDQYGDKVVLLGFPCDQFGGQEPGSNEEILEFCQKEFAVSFQLFDKIEVKGSNKAPLYAWLTNKSLNGWNDQEPTWNFCKYVIDESGKLMAFFPAMTDPLDEKIISLLK